MRDRKFRNTATSVTWQSIQIDFTTQQHLPVVFFFCTASDVPATRATQRFLTSFPSGTILAFFQAYVWRSSATRAINSTCQPRSIWQAVRHFFVRKIVQLLVYRVIRNISAFRSCARQKTHTRASSMVLSRSALPPSGLVCRDPPSGIVACRV